MKETGIIDASGTGKSCIGEANVMTAAENGTNISSAEKLYQILVEKYEDFESSGKSEPQDKENHSILPMGYDRVSIDVQNRQVLYGYDDQSDGYTYWFESNGVLQGRDPMSSLL